MISHADVLARASDCLRERFGTEFLAPYWQGKVEMAHCLLGELRIAQQETFEAVEELERSGRLRFRHLVWRATPSYENGTQVCAVPLERGMWRIDAVPHPERATSVAAAGA